VVPHLFNVPRGPRDEVRQIDLGFFGTPQLVENDLVAAIETVDYSLDLDAVVRQNNSARGRTLSHILAWIEPVLSESVSAKYGSPFFFNLTCFERPGRTK